MALYHLQTIEYEELVHALFFVTATVFIPFHPADVQGSACRNVDQLTLKARQICAHPPQHRECHRICSVSDESGR